MDTPGSESVIVRRGFAFADGMEMPFSGRYCSAL